MKWAGWGSEKRMWEGLKEEIRGNGLWMRKEHLEKNWKVLRHQWVEMVGSFLSGRKRCHFFPVENAVLITVYQRIILWEFSILPDSYFKFVLERNCHAAGSWHFCQALIIHVFYLEAKSVRSFQSGSYSWADGEALSLVLASSHLPASLTPWQFSPPRQKSGWQEPFKTATSKSNKAFVPSDWNVSLFRPNETWMYKQFCEKTLTLQMTLESTKILWYLLASASTS